MNFVSASQVAIDETAGFSNFNRLTQKLRASRGVKFISKEDEVDNIEWNFKYHGHKLTLQYNIYNGVTLYSNKSSDADIVIKLASNLKSTP